MSFSSRFMYWIAMDVRTSDAGTLAEFNRFYDRTHLPEVLAHNPGFLSGHRYELLRQDPRGDFGPRYLAAYELADESAVSRYLDAAPPRYTSSPPIWPDLNDIRWRLIYEQIARTGPAEVAPYGIWIIGIDPPADVDEAGLREFDDFYTGVHLPEVVERNGFLRGTRYERRHELRHPAPGCPRFLAVYEADQAAASAPPRPISYTDGPDAWRRHTTPWRLWYRRITH